MARSERDIIDAHIIDFANSTSLTDPPTKAEMEAQLLLIANAVNAILLALEEAGIVASS